MIPTENCGFSMLSSAAVKARMWVISRVMRNCSASFDPWECLSGVSAGVTADS